MISQRRITYLHNILIKPVNEWVRGVYDTQKKNPVMGIEKDLNKFDFNLIEKLTEKRCHG